MEWSSRRSGGGSSPVASLRCCDPADWSRAATSAGAQIANTSEGFSSDACGDKVRSSEAQCSVQARSSDGRSGAPAWFPAESCASCSRWQDGGAEAADVNAGRRHTPPWSSQNSAKNPANRFKGIRAPSSVREQSAASSQGKLHGCAIAALDEVETVDARDEVLITGGYGEVGGRISAHLASRHPGRVVIAGRDGTRAAAMAERVGNRARGITLDVHDPGAVQQALARVALVANCVDLREPHLLRAACEHGLAYTDVNASTQWRAARALRTQAERSGARIVIGTGVVPGISSAMARAAADRIGPLASVQTSLLLSIGDAFGPASLEFLLTEAGQTWQIVEAGREREVSFFSEGRSVMFPAPIGRRRVYRAPFADQFFYPQTLGVNDAAALLAIEPAWAGAAIAGLMRIGMRRWVAHARFRTTIQRAVSRLRGRLAGGNRFALVVEARGRNGIFRASLADRVQAEATAIASSLFARALLDGEIDRSGVWFPEEVVDPVRFFERLREFGLTVEQSALDRDPRAESCQSGRKP